LEIQMKVICTLPDCKFFKPLSPTESWFRWEDAQCDKIRIMAKEENPWDKAVAVMFSLGINKSYASDYTARLDLKVYPIEENMRKGIFVREAIKSSFPCTLRPCLFFAAFPIPTRNQIPKWLIYQMEFIQIPDTSAVHEESKKVEVKTNLSENPKTQAVEQKKIAQKGVSKKGVAEKGLSERNEDKSNEERRSESIVIVKEAVEALKIQHDWDSLKVRQKIELIKEQTLKNQGVSISSQTLYRSWVRSLW